MRFAASSAADALRLLVTFGLLSCSSPQKTPGLPTWGGPDEDTGIPEEDSAAPEAEDTGEVAIAPCWDESLGSATGLSVARGDTTAASHDWASDFDVHCGMSEGPDVAYLWRAPATDCYRFDTNGFVTDYDVMLSLFDPGVHGVCDGDGVTGGIACSDDEGDEYNALIEYSLDKYTPVLIIVDGYNAGMAGEYELNIQPCSEAESPTP